MLISCSFFKHLIALCKLSVTRKRSKPRKSSRDFLRQYVRDTRG